MRNGFVIIQYLLKQKKKHEVVPKRSFGEAIPKVAKEEKPLVNSMGLYESETRKKFLLERKKDFASYNQEQVVSK